MSTDVERPSEVDGRRERGRRTRASILETAANIASVEGLEGLTIGRLASELGMSKSGLFAHFGSKEELQLATIEAAREVFTARVIDPIRDAERGLPRLRALIGTWMSYLRGAVFDGGCFFDAVRAEFDSRPAGAVRDRIERDLADWHALLLGQIRTAKKLGHLRDDVDPQQLLFEIDALGTTASMRHQLTKDDKIYERAEAAIAARLSAAATPGAP